MPDATGLAKSIKQLAVDAVNAGNPVNICYGTVTSADPLEILVDQKLLLGEAQLVLTRNVTDYEIDVEIEEDYVWETEEGLTDPHTHEAEIEIGETDQTHIHEIVGEKHIKILNALEEGEEVLLIRQQEGQKYIVWDRLPEEDEEEE